LPCARLPGSLPGMAHDPHEPPREPPREPDDGSGRRGAVIGLLVTLLLVVAGYYLMTSLREQGRLEDCLMSHRTNCAPLDTSK
jgi:hypothetical protein